ncbi:hypothetical protein SISSUDRAFT_1121396 [Sistotremastrum suecicum HHB10207 ss-3]|uniref:Uncharacterized protein n=1 Tax=Sistotremastrum suecicum HHB10207 ss-3 TaxID=1314776 RepID=A0A166AVX1_9AGAM|nr:hypothetical protein SISSUDRAFT_1121396 [Sistotremastrum suecicum HHB10207 ss-3]
MKPSYLLRASFFISFLSFVSSKAIYDIHALDRLNASELLATQRSRGMTNARMLAQGLKRLQPPRSLAKQIVEGKKKRGNPVDTAHKAKRSEAPVSSCGMIGAQDSALQSVGFLNYAPPFFYRNPIAFVVQPTEVGTENYDYFDLPVDTSDLFSIGVEFYFSFSGSYLGAIWRSFSGTSAGPTSLSPGSTNIAFLEPVSLSSPGPGGSQSSIWSLNLATLELTATWTNPDGSRFPATIFWDADEDDGNVGLTGDLDAVIAAAKIQEGAPNPFCDAEANPVSSCAIPIRLFYRGLPPNGPLDPGVCDFLNP